MVRRGDRLTITRETLGRGGPSGLGHVGEAGTPEALFGKEFRCEAAARIDLAEYTHWLNPERRVVNIYQRYRELDPITETCTPPELFAVQAEWEAKGADDMGKLVRDRIPEIIRANGDTPRSYVLDAHAYEIALHEKLLEEAAELREADNRGDRLGEAADVLEVLVAMGEFYGFTLDEVRRVAADKAGERGGFRGRVWLE
ncbi:nucleoside triphosphate pyrophosphohydrolase [Nocardia terpenica]